MSSVADNPKLDSTHFLIPSFLSHFITVQQKGNLLKSPLEGSIVNEHLVGFQNNSNLYQQQQDSYIVNGQQLYNYLEYHSNLLQRYQNSSG